MYERLVMLLLPLVLTYGSRVFVRGHSWVEQMLVVSEQNGSFIGRPGYMRGYVPRGPEFSDMLNQNLIPDPSERRTQISDLDLLCKQTQRLANSTTGYPMLSVSPGDYIAIRYMENGHVTLPQNQIGKPGSGGSVYVFETGQPEEDEKIVNVLQWTSDGTGGDKRGRLVTVQDFDDGRCYQINDSPMQIQRASEFPNKPIGAAEGASNVELWCETDVRIAEDAHDGVVSLYWVWQWNTLPGRDPELPLGKAEWYTSCVDVNVQRECKDGAPLNFALLNQDPHSAAVPEFIARAANSTYRVPQEVETGQIS